MAEDAINALLAEISGATAKYVVVVFLDIRGAFDNAWWPSILAALRRRDTPPRLYNLVKDFLSGRHAVIRHESVTVEKEISKGCPQGSVLAPTLWNLIFDDLLSAPMPDGVNIFGYADDAAVVVKADSRPEVEHSLLPSSGERVTSSSSPRRKPRQSCSKARTHVLLSLS